MRLLNVWAVLSCSAVALSAEDPKWGRIIRAQIENACGLSYLVVRDRKTGKFLRVTESMARVKVGVDEEIIEVWEKDPNVQAAVDLLNRAIDKPAKQSMKVAVEGDWDKWAARLASARNRDPGET